MKTMCLAQQAARSDAAWVALSNEVLGNTRKRNALAKRILAGTSSANRALYAHHFGDDYNRGDAWRLLVDFVKAR